MMIRNPGTFTASNIVGWIMTGIGKGVIVGLAVFLTIVLADKKVLAKEVMQPFVPGFIIFLVAWIVSALFLTIFDFACLAILQCFLTNKEMGGTVATPDSLKDFIDKEESKYNSVKDVTDKVDTKVTTVVANANVMN